MLYFRIKEIFQSMANLLLNVVKRQKNDINHHLKAGYRSRSALPILQKQLSSPLVKVILGPRRCGKSTLALMALEGKSFAYLNFEDDSIPFNTSGDEVLSALLSVYGNCEFYFFDEIQNMDRWEQFIHRIHREGKNCVVSGSNAHLLSSELATALTGRHVAIQLLPFSYFEISQKKIEEKIPDFEKYLVHGGFPQVVLNRVDPTEYLRTLWDSIVLKDIVRRHKVRNVAALNEVYDLLIASVASKFNYDSLTRSLGTRVSAPTVKNFLRYASEAYLVSELGPFHFSTRKRIKSDRKIYTYDNGFVSAKRVQISGDKGRLLENLVFCELVRRGARPNIDLFYFQTSRGYEVDFLWRNATKKHQLIQVTWMMEAQKTKERELRALVDAAKELGLNSATILCYSLSENFEINGITIEVTPIQEWLMNMNQ